MDRHFSFNIELNEFTWVLEINTQNKSFQRNVIVRRVS